MRVNYQSEVPSAWIRRTLKFYDKTFQITFWKFLKVLGLVLWDLHWKLILYQFLIETFHISAKIEWGWSSTCLLSPTCGLRLRNSLLPGVLLKIYFYKKYFSSFISVCNLYTNLSIIWTQHYYNTTVIQYICMRLDAKNIDTHSRQSLFWTYLYFKKSFFPSFFGKITVKVLII